MARILHRRISRRVAPFSSPLLTQSLAGIACIGVASGLVGSIFTSAATIVMYVGITGLIALFTVCGLVHPDDFDDAQTSRAQRRLLRRTAKAAANATMADGALPEPLEA